MFGSRGRLVVVGLAVILVILAVVWLALEYFIPTPPSAITIATSVEGGAYELLGNRYKEILARSHVTVNVRRTEGAGENLRLLQDKNSNVQVGLVPGGISNGTLSPDLLSLGRISYQPFWLFHRSTEVWPDLTSIKGRIAVGAVGSDARLVLENLLHVSGVDDRTTMVSLVGMPALKALADGQVDGIFAAGSPDSPILQSLLRDPGIQLMNFPRSEALTRIFPSLVQLVLPAGAINFAHNIPATAVNLIGTTNAVLIRRGLHPQIVFLLTQALLEAHGSRGLFQVAGEFPTQTDPEYPMSESARDFYRNGPGFLNRYVPFRIANDVRRMIAILIAVIAITVPVITYAPRLYMVYAQQRLRLLYRRLRLVENAMQETLSAPQAEALQNDLAEIDRATGVVPIRDSDLYFMFRHHLDQIRSRLNARLAEAQRFGRGDCDAI